MSSTNKAVIPPVPRDASPEQRRFFNALREIVQIQAGKGRGDGLDRAVTFRDLKPYGGLDTIASGGSGTTTVINNGGGSSSGGDSGGAYDDDPYAPTGVEILPTFNSVVCLWDRVTTEWYSHTEIFRDIPALPDGWVEGDPVPRNVADAILVGSVSTPYFTDRLSSGVVAVYWVRHVNRVGVNSEYHSIDGTAIRVYDTPADMIAEYSRDIYNSELYHWLRSEIDYVSTMANLTGLSGLPDDHPFMQFIRAAGDYDDLLGELALQGAVIDHQTTLAASAESLSASAKVKEMVTTVAAENYAFASRMAALEASYNNMGAQVDAKIADYNTTLTSEFGAIATAINQITASYDGTDVTLQQLSSAVATADGRYVAQWGVKSSVGDLQGGVGFYNDGQQTQFLVDANVFAVTNGDGNTDAVAPFIVRNGNVYISEAYIDTAVVATLISDLIVANRVVAGVSIESPVIDGGAITSTTLAVNGRFLVDAAGNMTAINATISGHVEASSGTIDNVRITDTCVIEGSVYAKNIEGDVYNERVYPLTQILGGTNQTTLYTATVAPLAGSVSVWYTRSLTIPSVFVTYKGSGNANLNVTMRVLRDGVQIHSDTAAMSTVLDVIGNESRLSDTATLTGGVFDVIGKASSTVFTVELLSSISVAQNQNESLTVSRDAGGGDSVNVALFRTESSLS